MPTITASVFMALDGVVDPGVGNWHFPYFNDEMGKAVDGTHDADVMLFGRVTYDRFRGSLASTGGCGRRRWTNDVLVAARCLSLRFLGSVAPSSRWRAHVVMTASRTCSAARMRFGRRSPPSRMFAQCCETGPTRMPSTYTPT
jgi:hypothetical protein